MVINRAKRWVYLGSPKTASTSLHQLLSAPPFGGERTQSQHEMIVPEDCHDFFIFASVRNPYDRAASLWRHRLHDLYRAAYPKQGQLFCHVTSELAALLPFQRFVHQIVNRHYDNPFFEWTVTEWLNLKPDFLPNYEPRVDAVIHVETLAADLAALRLVDEEFEVPRVNVTEGQVEAVYDARSRELVQRWARMDIENYECE